MSKTRFVLSNRSSDILIFIALTSLAIALYFPAFAGPFLFDDFTNISLLGKDGGINDFSSWINFVFSGEHGTGRPVALLTFTLNGQNWPTDPYPFKVTNVLIHAVNAWLIFLFLRKLITLYDNDLLEGQLKYLPLVGALIWLIHPIHLTTILQVVQRMSLLSATFSLLALNTYLNYLLKNPIIKTDKNFYLTLTWITLWGLLGILSKETIILLPIFIFILNFTVLRQYLSNSNPRLINYVQYLLLLAPLLVLAATLILLNDKLNELWQIRDFDIWQRLLTESRILFQYLEKIFIPRIDNYSLFNDDILISTSLFTPVTTLFSITGILLLLIFAIKLRRTFPFMSLAILWFFAGHILESTVWPLELYFDHRNYFPSLFLAFFMIEVYLRIQNNLKVAALVITGTFALASGFVTQQNTNVWADKISLYTVWANEKPNSIRAQQEAANVWLNQKADPVTARKFLIRAIQAKPDSTSSRARLMQVNCYFVSAADDPAKLSQSFSEGPFEWGTISAISNIASMKEKNECQSISFEQVILSLTRLIENKKYSSNTDQSTLHLQKSKMLYQVQNYQQALHHANISTSHFAQLEAIILKMEIADKTGEKAAMRAYLDEALPLESKQIRYLSKTKLDLYNTYKLQFLPITDN